MKHERIIIIMLIVAITLAATILILDATKPKITDKNTIEINNDDLEYYAIHEIKCPKCHQKGENIKINGYDYEYKGSTKETIEYAQCVRCGISFKVK